jgi:hypothetical protein
MAFINVTDTTDGAIVVNSNAIIKMVLTPEVPADPGPFEAAFTTLTMAIGAGATTIVIDEGPELVRQAHVQDIQKYGPVTPGFITLVATAGSTPTQIDYTKILKLRWVTNQTVVTHLVHDGSITTSVNETPYKIQSLINVARQNLS